ncbi:hypothetical protein, partial [Propionicimonas sp.]|uniref:protein-tyrosine phosphatase family protein n=1 Tax=Propionicimonas sp. TaxID=1955623 RepID=UPI0039E71C22
MIAPRLFTIQRADRGQLSTMAAPRAGGCLQEEVRAVRFMGVDTLVSMLTEQENGELDLVDEAEAATEAELRYATLPTPDRETPAEDPTRALARMLADDLHAGHGVAIHCRAGIGRSSVLAAAVLQLEGVPADEAWNLISHARG